MDRVRLENEERGSATYYMAESPHAYGERIYEIEKMQDIEIASVRMDVGLKQGASWRYVHSEEEYKRLIWKTKGEEVYQCIFDILKLKDASDNQSGLPITVKLDFLKKRLTLQVDPDLIAQEKNQLSEFYEMLTEENYYLDREVDRLGEELASIKNLSMIGKGALIAAFVLLVVWIFISDEDLEAEPSLITPILGVISMLISVSDGIRQQLLRRACKRKLSDIQKE